MAELTGGTVQGEPGKMGLKITMPGVKSTDVDVIGGSGEYIAVGGPSKANNLSGLGASLKVLKYAADQQGVPAQAWFELGTPQAALNVAAKWLGWDNVFTFANPTIPP